MDIFIILILTHLISDFIFQPGKWAVEKIKNSKLRFYHSVQYTILFIPILYFLNLSLFWGSWIFGTHFLIDDRKFVNWWNKKIRARGIKTPEWMMIVQDQILHILVLIPLIVIK